MEIRDTITTMAITGNTTKSRSRPARAGRISRRMRSIPLLLFIAVLVSSLLALAWPRLRANIQYLPVQTAINQYLVNGELSRDRLVSLQNSALESIAILEHQRYWAGLSLLYYVQAISETNALNDRRMAFEGSVSAIDHSLALAPVQPDLWIRKAIALNWLSFIPNEAIEAFKMSVYTGRVEPILFMPRLQFGYSRLTALDDEARGLLRDQTQLAWEMEKSGLLKAITNGRLDIVRIRFLLFDSHPDLLAEIEAELGPKRT